MRPLPAAMMVYLLPFAPRFTRRTWRHVPLLVVGAILAPGRRMVTSIWGVTGHGDDGAFCTYHRVRHRAVWARLGARRILLGLRDRRLCSRWPAGAGDRSRPWNAAAARRSPRPEFTAIPCARATDTLAKRGPCGGSVSCSSCRSRGRDGPGPCPSSRFLPPPNALTGSTITATHRSPTGPVRWSGSSIALVPPRRLVLVGDTTYAAIAFLAATRPGGHHRHPPAPGRPPLHPRRAPPPGTERPVPRHWDPPAHPGGPQR